MISLNFLFSFQHKKKECIRLCLKYLRQNNLTEVFDQLQKNTMVKLEHPILTDLHNELTIQGSYSRVESIIETAIESKKWDSYAYIIQYGIFLNHVQNLNIRSMGSITYVYTYVNRRSHFVHLLVSCNDNLFYWLSYLASLQLQALMVPFCSQKTMLQLLFVWSWYVRFIFF